MDKLIVITYARKNESIKRNTILNKESPPPPPPSASNSRASFNISQLQLITTHGQREAARAAI